MINELRELQVRYHSIMAETGEAVRKLELEQKFSGGSHKPEGLQRCKNCRKIGKLSEC
jgi:hypothetical protein